MLKNVSTETVTSLLWHWKEQSACCIVKKFPWWVTPNGLSILRMLLGLVILILILSNYPKEFLSLRFFLIFLLGTTTDFLDGPLARLRKCETQLGASLDSFADKILLLPILAYFLRSEGKLLFFLIIFGEFSGQLIKWYGINSGIFMGYTVFGRWKTVSQSLGILLFFFHKDVYALYILCTALGFSIAGVIQHSIKIYKHSLCHVQEFT